MLITALLTIALTFGNEHERAASDARFVGSTPCAQEVLRFLGVPSKAQCDFIVWNMALSSAGTSQVKLDVLYGVAVPNEPGLKDGGNAVRLAGSWTLRTDGAGNANVYQLTIDGRRMEFRKLDENLLHPLNSRGTLMVGTSGWSYTLTAANPSAARNQPPSLEPVSGTLPALAGVFEGRTPCAVLAARLSIADRGCAKLKWRLTLYQDLVTQAPTRYVLEGTAFRQAPRTGKWTVVRSKTDPTRLIYRLDPDGSAAFLSFVRADEHILLFVDDDGNLLPGNSDFSYTLNRVARRHPR